MGLWDGDGILVSIRVWWGQMMVRLAGIGQNWFGYGWVNSRRWDLGFCVSVEKKAL